MGFVADHNGHQVIGACSGLGFDDNGHPQSKNHASCNKDNNTYCKRKRAVDIVSKDYSEKINDRSPKEHTDNGSDPYVASVNHKQYQYDQKADHHMSASVSPVKCIRPWNASENSLYQNIKRVCAKVCLNKKGNPQMGYRQTKNKQNDLFDFLRKCHSR